MKLLIDVSSYYDWQLRHRSQVEPDDVAVPSVHGEDLLNVRQLVREASVTEVHVPDGSVDRMLADHKAGVAAAAESEFPRMVRSKAARELVADHLAEVMAQHAPGEHIRQVRVVDSPHDEEGRKRLERFLNNRLAADGDDDGWPVEEDNGAGDPNT
jgi:hypothetical protein